MPHPEPSIGKMSEHINGIIAEYPDYELATAQQSLDTATQQVGSLESGQLAEVSSLLEAAQGSLHAAIGHLSASRAGLATYLKQISDTQQAEHKAAEPAPAILSDAAVAPEISAVVPEKKSRLALPAPECDTVMDDSHHALGGIAAAAATVGKSLTHTFGVVAERLTGKRRTRTPTQKERQRQKLRDTYLIQYFPTVVESLDMQELAVIQPGRKRPRSLAQFRLVPVTGTTFTGGSLREACSALKIPPGVRATYYGNGEGLPFMDTSLAIGLVRGDWLVAVAGGGLDRYGDLIITQIQDVSGSSRGRGTSGYDPRAKYKTGLHDGFLWRDTLVNAWAEIARTTRVSNHLVIQGGRNNYWTAVSKTPEHDGYDGVARRMGHFSKDNEGNWVWEFPEIQPIYSGKLPKSS